MRALLCFCSLWLILMCGTAYAEPEEEPIGSTPQAAATQPGNPGAVAAIRKSPTPSVQAATRQPTEGNSPELIRKRGAEWLAQCLKDWDAATHMTKKDWQRVCRRVSEERVNELIKQAKN
jgi:hypothetical protein